MKKITPVFLIIILMSACSIEKRHYRKGYSVQWQTQKKAVTLPHSSAPDATELTAPQNLSAAINPTPVILLKEEKPLPPVITKQKKQRKKHLFQFNFPARNYATKNHEVKNKSKTAPPAGGIFVIGFFGLLGIAISIFIAFTISPVLGIVLGLLILFSLAFGMYQFGQNGGDNSGGGGFSMGSGGYILGSGISLLITILIYAIILGL